MPNGTKKRVTSSRALEPTESLFNQNLKKQWKLLIRQGIPNYLTREKILDLFDIDPNTYPYNRSWDEVFSGHIPKEFRRAIPTFWEKTEIKEIVGKLYIKDYIPPIGRILWVVNQEYSWLQYAPLVVTVLSLLLIYLDEHEAFAVLTRMIQYSGHHNREANIRWHL